jgi:hypothetical protein
MNAPDNSPVKLHELDTAAFFTSLFPQEFQQSHGSGDNAIEQRHIIVYGRQGVGKTNSANWIIQQARIRYPHQVNVQVAPGENFRSLLTSSNWTNQPVQILVVEDLTNVKLKDEELRDFFRIRHIMAQRTGLMEGLCVVIFTCHRFHDTPILFRSDYDGLIVLSAPTNDWDFQFIERKITPDGVKLLDKAEANNQRGFAIVTYRRSLVGYIQLPFVASVASTVQPEGLVAPSLQTNVQVAAEPSTRSPRSSEQVLIDDLSYHIEQGIDDLVTRWENWNPEYNRRTNALIVMLGFAALLVGTIERQPGVSFIGFLWLAAAFLYWTKSKR